MKLWQNQRLKDNESGVALIEFALALPLLILLYLGGIETSRYIQAQQKIDKLAHTMVDLVAQAQTINTQDLDQIMQAAAHVTKPLNFAQDGNIIISCVGYDNNQQLIVKWQYIGGGNLNRTSKIGATNAEATLPEMLTLDSKDNVIIAEIYFTYDPLINDTILAPTEFYRSAYHLPRLGALDTLGAG